MQRTTPCLAFLVALGCALSAVPDRASAQSLPAPADPAGDGWVTATPAELGRSAAPFAELTEAVRKGDAYRNVHAVLIALGGRLVYEEYFAGEDVHRGVGSVGHVVFDATRRHDLRSVTKSVVSALVGTAVGSGAIASIDAPVLDFLPELPDLATPERRAMTLRHVLTMTMGTEWVENIPYTDPKNDETRMNRSDAPMRIVLERDVVAPHGARWNYSGGSTQLLAEVVERATGMRIEEYARQVLWEPLGVSDVEWADIASGQASAASGLRLRPRDQLRFGQLYVDEGRWRGRQVVPAEWIAATLARSIALPDSLADLGEDASAVFGYGFQWWLGHFTLPYGRFTMHWAQGNGGQFIWVVPDLELVAVVNAGNYNAPHDGERLFLERILPWAVGVDSAFAFWKPRAYRAFTAGGEMRPVELGAAERARYVGTYAYEHKQVRVWEDAGALYVTSFLGSEDGAIRLVPLGNHVFAYGRYRDGALTGIYWPKDRLEFKLEGGRVVAFDDRAESGSVYVTAPRVDAVPDGAAAPTTQEKPVVAVIGTGIFGGALGPRLGELGYPVVYGSREPERASVRELVGRSGATASAATPREAAAKAQIIVLAVPMEALEEVSRNLGPLAGKVLVDVSGGPKRLGADGYMELASDSSNAERLQARHPEARVVRVGFPLVTHFVDPLALGPPPTVPIAGDSAGAKEAVARVVFDMGLDPWDAGPVRYARLLDALGLLSLTPLQQGRAAGVDVVLLRNTALPCFIDVKAGFGFGTPYDAGRLAQFPERAPPLSCDEWRKLLPGMEDR